MPSWATTPALSVLPSSVYRHKRWLLCPLWYRCKNSLACDHPAFFLDGLDACFAFADYSHEAAQAVHRLKFQNQPQLARVFAILMAQHLGPALLEEEPDLLCGVAMHTKRKRKRGYNQAQLIAQELAKQLHLPCQQLLEKTAATAAQHTLSAAERRTNLQGVYRVLDEQQVAGKRILLVDDVITTGATVDECAALLRKSGVKTVHTACIAKTPKHFLH